MVEQWNDMTRGSTITVAASDALHPDQAHYRCDGLADEEEIHQANDDLLANGGTIQLTEGTFSTTTTVSISSNVVLKGMGIDITTLVGTGIGSHYKIIQNSDPSGGNTNIHIRDLTVDGNWTSGVTTGGGAIQFTKCTDSDIIDVKVHHAHQHDVCITRSQRIHLVRLNCYAAQADDCITVTDGSGVSESRFIWITDCYVHDSGTESYQSGIEIDDGPQHVYVTGCVAENFTSHPYNVHIHPDQKGVSHIYFTNCTAKAAPANAYGLIIYNSSTIGEVIEHIVIENCTLPTIAATGGADQKHIHVTDCTADFIYICQVSEDVKIVNNEVANPTTIPAGMYGGITVNNGQRDCNGVKIQGNTVSTQHRMGIFIDVRAGRTITYLNILDNIGYPVGQQTVFMQGPGAVDHVRISGNQCHGHMGIGIAKTAPSALTMTNWIIEDNPGVNRKAGGILTILAANTSIAVAHGIDKCGSDYVNEYTLSATPKETIGNATEFWCNIWANTNFEIHVDVAPGADTDFYFEIDATRGAAWVH